MLYTSTPNAIIELSEDSGYYKSFNTSFGVYSFNNCYDIVNGNLYGISTKGLFSYSINENKLEYLRYFEEYVSGKIFVKDKDIYGTVYNDGKEFLFHFNIDSKAYEILHYFDTDSLGKDSYGNRICIINNTIVGITNNGGLNDNGVLYEYNLNTGVFSKIYDLNSLGLWHSHDNLYEGNGKLYASANSLDEMTTNIFEYDPVNKQIRIIDKVPRTGTCNYYSYLYNDGYLYGHTIYGNEYLYSINLGNDSLQYLYEFSSSDSVGSRPLSCPVVHENKMYGACHSGGANGFGTLYEYNLADSTVKKIYDFDSISGSGPDSHLSLYGNELYGFTESGGLTDHGTFFKYNLITNECTVIYNQGYIEFGNFKYGMTARENNIYTISNRSIISFNKNDGQIQSYYNFAEDLPSRSPVNTPVIFNDKVYGACINSTGNDQYIYEYDLVNENLNTYFNNFGNSGDYYLYNNKLYGIGEYFFSFDLQTKNFEQIKFMGYVNDNNLIFSNIGDTLYGCYYKESETNAGYLFQYIDSSQLFEIIYNFDSMNYPLYKPVKIENFIYGTAVSFSPYYSYLYSLNLNNFEFKILDNFDTDSTGSTPKSNLVYHNNKLYGTCRGGGKYLYGTYFYYDFNDNKIKKLIDFNHNITGGTPNLGFVFYEPDDSIPPIYPPKHSVVYHNVENKTIHVWSNFLKILKIDVYDLKGNLLLTRKNSSTDIFIKTALPNSAYILKVYTEANTEIIKILIM